MTEWRLFRRFNLGLGSVAALDVNLPGKAVALANSRYLMVTRQFRPLAQP